MGRTSNSSPQKLVGWPEKVVKRWCNIWALRKREQDGCPQSGKCSSACACSRTDHVLSADVFASVLPKTWRSPLAHLGKRCHLRSCSLQRNVWSQSKPRLANTVRTRFSPHHKWCLSTWVGFSLNCPWSKRSATQENWLITSQSCHFHICCSIRHFGKPKSLTGCVWCGFKKSFAVVAGRHTVWRWSKLKVMSLGNLNCHNVQQ